MGVEVCTVACKLPGGLIIQHQVMEPVHEPVMGGGSREVLRARGVGVRVVLFGSATRIDRAPEHRIVGGYGLTPNIDAAWFAEWLKQNEDHDAVRNRLVFALPKLDATASEAVKMATNRSGLEPVNPHALPKGIKTAEKTA